MLSRLQIVSLLCQLIPHLFLFTQFGSALFELVQQRFGLVAHGHVGVFEHKQFRVHLSHRTVSHLLHRVPLQLLRSHLLLHLGDLLWPPCAVHLIICLLQLLQFIFSPFHLHFGLTQLHFRLLHICLHLANLGIFSPLRLVQLHLKEAFLFSEQLNVSLRLFPLIFEFIQIDLLLEQSTLHLEVILVCFAPLLLQLGELFVSLRSFAALHIEFASKFFDRAVIAVLQLVKVDPQLLRLVRMLVRCLSRVIQLPLQLFPLGNSLILSSVCGCIPFQFSLPCRFQIVELFARVLLLCLALLFQLTQVALHFSQIVLFLH